MCVRYVYLVALSAVDEQYDVHGMPCYVDENNGRWNDGTDSFRTTLALYNSDKEAEAAKATFSKSNSLTEYSVFKIPVFGSRGLSLG